MLLVHNVVSEDLFHSVARYYFLIVAAVVLIALYTYDNWDLKQKCGCVKNEISFGYQEHNGPLVWERRYPSARGSNQSPVNLRDRIAIKVSSENAPPLTFSEDFHWLPNEMKVYNNGYNIVISASWPDGKKPSVVGGPLTEDYNFLNLRFRWGSNDFDGSEHLVNSSGFAMELQAAFTNSNFNGENVLQASADGHLLMISYLFKVTPRDNPYLEPIINCLKYVQYPMSCIGIDPVIISLLMPGFSKYYFTYVGSLTFPPCTEGVRWIVKPEPIMISSRQIQHFRNLYGCDGRIMCNIRPVQRASRIEILYYE